MAYAFLLWVLVMMFSVCFSVRPKTPYRNFYHLLYVNSVQINTKLSPTIERFVLSLDQSVVHFDVHNFPMLHPKCTFSCIPGKKITWLMYPHGFL